MYALEAARRNAAGAITHVRWHSLEVEGNLPVHGDSVVVPVEIAMRAAATDAVHICYHGAAGSRVGVGQHQSRTTLVDMPGTPADQTLASLPSV